MKFGDTIRIEMKGRDGQSIFGAIDQNIESPDGAAAKAREEPAATAEPPNKQTQPENEA